ncbi:MAG: response regulator [Bacteriovoracaceae bacterium]|nr:response regulator [Bacteriovoracaceae bacterium]
MNSEENRTILLVDDEPGLLELMKEGLEDFNFLVFCASNGSEALEMMKKHSVDCLITDIKMPVMGGIELVTKLRESRLTIPVFFITAYQDLPKEVLANLQPKAIIFKPFDIEEAALLVKNYFLRNP